jgi:hypothetical protein
MRSLLFLLTLVLAACGGNGDGFKATPEPLQHVPAISNLKLTPERLTVTAEISFRDAGLDIQTLKVQMPDGVTIDFNESFATETGTFTEDFDISTDKVGAFVVDFWLVDNAGDSSLSHSAVFEIIADLQGSDWTSRMSGLPFVLNDVTWDGTVFVAVGDGGAILTSPNGIDWLLEFSGTDADLNAVAAHGSDIFAVGDEIVLLSINHGKNWITKTTLNAADVTAVALSANRVVVAGFNYGLVAPVVLLSIDRGDTWQVVTPFESGSNSFADLIFRDDLFVAAVAYRFDSSATRVEVSADGKDWSMIPVGDEEVDLYSVTHDGSQFVVAGAQHTVFTSLDGFNWTERQTPVEDVDYMSAASDGSRLILAGGISWVYWWAGTPSFERPVGIVSTDGGESWEFFNIDGFFESRGMAWGNGRFVSVGQSSPISGEGAIYTAD